MSGNNRRTSATTTTTTTRTTTTTATTTTTTPTAAAAVVVVPPIQRLLIVCLPCIVACFVRVTLAQSLPCPEANSDEPLPFLKAVLLSNVVLHGRVLRTYPDVRYRDGVYTAEVEVYCIIKGGRTERVVNITEAGLLPGKCFSTLLLAGSNYIILVQFNGSVYSPVESERPGTNSNLNEVASTCHINPKYPIGVTERTTVLRCPTPKPPGECVDIDYFTTTTTTTEPAPTVVDYYDYPTDEPVLVEPNPSGADSQQGQSSSSKSPVLFTSKFSTSSTTYCLNVSVRLLPNSLESAKEDLVGTDQHPLLPSPIEKPERIQPNATSADADEPIAKETTDPRQFPTTREELLPGVTDDYYPSIYSLRNGRQRKTPSSRHKSSLRPRSVLRRAKQTERRTLKRTRFEQENPPTWKRQRQRQRPRQRQRLPVEADYRHRLPSPRDTNY